MGTLLESLHNLQAVEEKLTHVRKRLGMRERASEVQELKIEQLTSEHQSLQEQCLTLRKRADEAELDIRTKDEQVTKLRGTLNTAKTNKEYAALLTQINTLKADNAKGEDEGLGILQQSEDAREQADALNEKIQTEQKRLEDIRNENAEEIAKLTKMREKLDADRSLATEGIPAGAMSTFNRIAGKYDGEAMAMVEIHGRRVPHSYVCGGCFMSLNSEHANALQVHDQIRQCDNCGRILFMDPCSVNSAD